MKREPILRRITEGCELQGEAIPGQVLVEINGMDRVLVENHRCIIGYTEQEVLVKVEYGTVCITGSGLVLASVQKDRLVIHGKILSVYLMAGDNDAGR